MGFTKDLALIGLMTVSKLSASADDVVWLTPFLRGQKSNGFVYIIMMTFVCTFSILLSIAAVSLMKSMMDNDGYWGAERVLSLAGSILLMFFAVYLFFDEMYGDDDSDEEEGESGEKAEKTPREIHDAGGVIEIASNTSQASLQTHHAREKEMKDEQKEDKIVIVNTVDEATKILDDAEDLSECSESLDSDSDLHLAIDPALIHAESVRKSMMSTRSSFAPMGQLVHILKESETSVDDAKAASSPRRSFYSPRASFAALKNLSSRASFAALGSLANIFQKSKDEEAGAVGAPIPSLTSVSRDLTMIYTERTYTRSRLCTVCILGSMDDAVIQIILLLSNQVKWYHLLLGNNIGSLIVLCVCFLGSRISWFADCMEFIPLWVVIGLFSIYCMTFTFVDL